MKIDVIKLDGGKASGSLDLSDEIFGIEEIRAGYAQMLADSGRTLSLVKAA